MSKIQQTATKNCVRKWFSSSNFHKITDLSLPILKIKLAYGLGSVSKDIQAQIQGAWKPNSLTELLHVRAKKLKVT